MYANLILNLLVMIVGDNKEIVFDSLLVKNIRQDYGSILITIDYSPESCVSVINQLNESVFS